MMARLGGWSLMRMAEEMEEWESAQPATGGGDRDREHDPREAAAAAGALRMAVAGSPKSLGWMWGRGDHGFGDTGGGEWLGGYLLLGKMGGVGGRSQK